VEARLTCDIDHIIWYMQRRFLRRILKDIKYILWELNGLIGLKCRSNVPQKATVLIAYFNPIRMRHVNHQLRNILKCEFVGKIIISNHNPQVQINPLIVVRDDRITIVNHEIRRGCGYRWLVAHEYAPEYLIVMDDDILMFSCQLARLFKSLVAEPEIPHGFAGMVQNANSSHKHFNSNSTSPTPMRPGSAAPTRTQMVFCDNTFPKI
jgi:hypothetical protein